MLGKPLSKNLQYYFTSVPAITAFNAPIVLFDRNVEKTLPSIVVGYSEENMSFWAWTEMNRICEALCAQAHSNARRLDELQPQLDLDAKPRFAEAGRRTFRY